MPDARARAFCLVLRYQGLRRSEACGLEWRHVHLAPQGPGAPHGTIAIEQQRTTDGSEARVLKTASSKAVLPLRFEVAEGFRAIRDVPSRPGKLARFIFPYYKRELLILGAAFRRAVPGLPAAALWHVLRHAFAADLLEAEVAVPWASKAMRHASIATTQRYYDAMQGDAAVPEVFAALARMEHRRPRANETAAAFRDKVPDPLLVSPDRGNKALKSKSKKENVSTPCSFRAGEQRVTPLRPMKGKEKT